MTIENTATMINNENVNYPEEFKLCQKYPAYSISNHGRIYSHLSNKILKPAITLGYEQVNLVDDDGLHMCYVHKLVAYEFIDNPNDKKIVDHIDGNKRNNYVHNLRWATSSENSMNRKNTYNIFNYKGVRMSGTIGKYVCYTTNQNKSCYLGTYDTPEDAAIAYNNFAIKNYGEFASLNVIKNT